MRKGSTDGRNGKAYSVRGSLEDVGVFLTLWRCGCDG